LGFKKRNKKNQLLQYMENVPKLFISYSHKDKEFLDNILSFLKPIEKQGKIVLWYDELLSPGEPWHETIIQKLNETDIYIPLVSSDFMVSDYLQDEVVTAIERATKSRLYIVPVLIRPCLWTHSPLNKFQFLPRGAKPVSEWSSPDEAYFDIAKGIDSLISTILSEKDRETEKKGQQKIKSKKEFKLEEVFVTSGSPNITFVKPKEYDYIKFAILQKGKGIVIEGPSGIGKTTTTKNILEGMNQKYAILTARLSKDVDLIKTIGDWHTGILVIDDFHRLDSNIQSDIVDYLKYLADNGDKDKKLIIIGIPNTGNSLIEISFDLATRITIFKLEASDESTIEELITKGENALNIEFNDKSQIIRSAFGSLYIAQVLCAYCAMINGIEKTQMSHTVLKKGIYLVTERIITDLSPKFDNVVRFFASVGGIKDKTSIEILKELASNEEGILNFHHLKVKRPELKIGIDKLLANKDIEKFYVDYPLCRKHMMFDPRIPMLVIDDPQFKFYLNNSSIDRLILLTGKIEVSVKSKVFISYSRLDEEWLSEILKYLKHLERKGLIDLWVDKRIKAGQNWRKEIDAALRVTKVAILLISQNFLASDFIVDNELPPLLEAAEVDNATILEVILMPCSLNQFPELSKFQSINDPKSPLAGMSDVDKAETLVKLADRIGEIIEEE
jgi:hypothetical protein